jgi:hypothetical protein
MEQLSKLKTNIQGAPSLDEDAILADCPELCAGTRVNRVVDRKRLMALTIHAIKDMKKHVESDTKKFEQLRSSMAGTQASLTALKNSQKCERSSIEQAMKLNDQVIADSLKQLREMKILMDELRKDVHGLLDDKKGPVAGKPAGDEGAADKPGKPVEKKPEEKKPEPKPEPEKKPEPKPEPEKKPEPKKPEEKKPEEKKPETKEPEKKKPEAKQPEESNKRKADDEADSKPDDKAAPEEKPASGDKKEADDVAKAPAAKRVRKK